MYPGRFKKLQAVTVPLVCWVNPQEACGEDLEKAPLPWRAERSLESEQGAARKEGIGSPGPGNRDAEGQDVYWAGKPDAVLLGDRCVTSREPPGESTLPPGLRGWSRGCDEVLADPKPGTGGHRSPRALTEAHRSCSWCSFQASLGSKG